VKRVRSLERRFIRAPPLYAMGFFPCIGLFTTFELVLGNQHRFSFSLDQPGLPRWAGADRIAVQSFTFGSGKEGYIPFGNATSDRPGELTTADPLTSPFVIGSKSGRPKPSPSAPAKVNPSSEALTVVLAPQYADRMMKLAQTGKPIPNVRLILYKSAGGVPGDALPFVIADMRVVRIVSDDWKGAPGDKASTNVTLDYLAIQIIKRNATPPTQEFTAPIELESRQ
jgi:hypothetical protein